MWEPATTGHDFSNNVIDTLTANIHKHFFGRPGRLDFAPFIDAIIADPHDDVARLVFADFLEEYGDARAEMIRLQFQIADLDRWDKSRSRLRTRELKLLREYGVFGTTPDVAKVTGYRGGFVDAVELTVTRFLKLQDELFTAAPVRDVRLKSRSVKFQKIRDSKWLGQLSALALDRNEASDDDYVAVVSAPTMTRLNRLEILSGDMTSAGVQRLANAANLQSVKELHLWTWNVDDQAAQAIADSPVLNSLESLEIRGRQTDMSVQLLANSPNCNSLRSLRIDGSLTDASIQYLQNGASCELMESLNFELLPEQFANAFDTAKTFAELKNLTLQMEWRNGRRAGISPEVLERLLTCCPKLEMLDLTRTGISDKSAAVLAGHPMLQNLKKLMLTGNQLSKKGVMAIADSPHFRKGLKLYVRSNQMSVRDIRDLRKKYGKTFGNMEPETELRFMARFSQMRNG